MVAFIFGVSSVLVYYVLLLSWIFLFSRIADKISYNMSWTVHLAVLINLVLGSIAIFFGLFKMAKGIKDVKDRFLNKVGVTYGIFTIIIWCFLFLSFLWQALMNWACATVSTEGVTLFKITLTALSIIPMILSVFFLARLIRISRNRKC